MHFLNRHRPFCKRSACPSIDDIGMDPITALSVAAAALQFLDFARSIVCKSTEIYRSKSGLTRSNEENEPAADKLANALKRPKGQVGLPQSDTSGTEWLPKYASEDMQRRYRQMQQDYVHIGLAKIMTEKLLQLKLPPRGQFRQWKSFRQALKTVWEKSSIDAVAMRLGELRRTWTPMFWCSSSKPYNYQVSYACE